jgi:hypothetical protein
VLTKKNRHVLRTAKVEMSLDHTISMDNALATKLSQILPVNQQWLAKA